MLSESFLKFPSLDQAHGYITSYNSKNLQALDAYTTLSQSRTISSVKDANELKRPCLFPRVHGRTYEAMKPFDMPDGPSRDLLDVVSGVDRSATLLGVVLEGMNDARRLSYSWSA